MAFATGRFKYKKTGTFWGGARLLREPAEAGCSGGRVGVGRGDLVALGLEALDRHQVELVHVVVMLLAVLLAHERRIADVETAEAVDLLAGGRRTVVHGELVGLQRVDGDRDRQAGNHCLDGAGTLDATLAGTGLLLHGTAPCTLVFDLGGCPRNNSTNTYWPRRYSSVFMNFVNSFLHVQQKSPQWAIFVVSSVIASLQILHSKE